jgi:hypothetical protein
MSTPARRPRPTFLLLTLFALAGCAGGGEEVTTRSLRAASRTWDQAKVRDYDLEWTSSGARAGHYRVFVRGGRVQAVYMVVLDRKTGREKELEAHTAAPRFFGVDGLFQTMEEELDQAQADTPFGQPKGTQVVLRFTPDPQLGYPRQYRRDVLGSSQRLAIDVLRLDSHPPEAIRPPRA